MSRLEFRSRARRDLLGIWQYIAQDNISAADRLAESIHRTLNQIAATPGIGHRRADVRDPRYLFHSVGKYVIAYQVDGDVVRVMRVVHGARDFSKLFPPP